jgi:DNA-binding response OmpR family regulator
MQSVTGSPFAEDYIDKPVDPNFLIKRVRKFIRK